MLLILILQSQGVITGLSLFGDQVKRGYGVSSFPCGQLCNYPSYLFCPVTAQHSRLEWKGYGQHYCSSHVSLRCTPFLSPFLFIVSPWIRSLAFQKPPLFTQQETVSPTQLPERFVAVLYYSRIALVYVFTCFVSGLVMRTLRARSLAFLFVILQHPALTLYRSQEEFIEWVLFALPE